jgi:dephospho-CoA kinase
MGKVRSAPTGQANMRRERPNERTRAIVDPWTPSRERWRAAKPMSEAERQTASATLVLEPYDRVPVQIRPWDPRSVEVGARLVSSVERAVADVLPSAHAEHIGSSAVPEMVGKGVIDLQLAVAPVRLAAVVQALLDAGWQRRTNPGEFFPETRPMLRAAVTVDGTRYRAHLHLVVEGSPEVIAQIAFRDALRADGALRDRYAARKHDVVAAGTTDGNEYAKAKSDVIREALRALGFAPGD